MNKNVIIFLTACINPEKMAFTALLDIDLRKKHYINAINFYLIKTNLKILFVENSGVDLSYLFQKEIKNDRLEMLTFNGNDHQKSLGKGVGEMVILEHAIAKSIFFKKTDFLFKITGRYKILNINQFIKQYFKNNSVDLLVNMQPKLCRADSRLFGSNKAFYNTLVKYKNTIDETNKVYFEHVLYKAVYETVLSTLPNLGKSKFAILNNIPRYSGVKGTDKLSYNDSWIYWFIKNSILKLLLFAQRTIHLR